MNTIKHISASASDQAVMVFVDTTDKTHFFELADVTVEEAIRVALRLFYEHWESDGAEILPTQ